MKRFLSAVLSIMLFCSFLTVNVSADQDVPDMKVTLLTDLGIIGKYEPDATVTRDMMMNFLDILYGQGGYTRYFEDKDRNSPVLYGQVLKILVDLTGYSAYLDLYGLDKNNTDSYLKAAVSAGITKKRIGSYTGTLQVIDYADMVFNALCVTNMVTYKHINKDGLNYQLEEGRTLLNSVLKLSYKDGIVTGTNTTSLSGSDGRKGSLAVDGTWYLFNSDEDMMDYLGLPVRIYYDDDEGDDDIGEIKSIFVREDEMKSVTVETEDIISKATNIRRVEYFGETRRRGYDIDSEADFVYNRRVSESFSDSDLYLPDCTYRFIDNDNDSKIDVIIADKYTCFTVDTIIEKDCQIIDENSVVYDLTDYLEDGYFIYNKDGKEIGLDDIGQNNVVSYQKSRDGEYTNFIVSNQKVSGIVESLIDGWKEFEVSGEEYKCLEQYLSNAKNFENINLGDEVELFLDFKGYVANIKRITGTVKSGYVLGGYYNLNIGKYALELLQEDGKIGRVEFSKSVKFNGVKKKAKEIINNSTLFADGTVVNQLILYKTSSSGLITSIDTAEDKSGIGANDNSGFTLDYDYETETTLRAITLNGQTVLGSKYLPNGDTKVFGINTDEKDMCYVQSGTAVPTASSLKIKLYNVNEDYVPEYVVIDSTTSLGNWVDWWEKTYVVDEVREAYIKETGEEVYKIYYYDGDGNLLSAIARHGDLKSPNGNALSGDSRFRKVYLRDVPRGTVVQFNDNETGITSFAIQSMPMQDNSEIIFEKSNTVSGNDYGISEYVFNGSSICSYGKVIKRISGGIVINSHLPTDVETAKGGVFPMSSWNRTIPLAAADVVLFYDKSENKLEKGNASEILEGDMIFMHRRAGTIMTTVVYR